MTTIVVVAAAEGPAESVVAVVASKGIMSIEKWGLVVVALLQLRSDKNGGLGTFSLECFSLGSSADTGTAGATESRWRFRPRPETLDTGVSLVMLLTSLRTIVFVAL